MATQRSLRLAASAAGVIGLAVVGVFIGRSLADEPSGEAAQQQPAVTAPPADRSDAGDVDAAREGETRLVPVLRAVHVGGGDDIGRLLLESDAPEPGEPLAETSGAWTPDFAGAIAISSSAADDAPPPAGDGPVGDEPAGDGSSGDGSDRADEDAGPGTEGPTSSDAPEGTDEDTGGESTETDYWLFPLESGGWPWRFGWFHIDPCAGASPGEPTPEGCPDGNPATFGGTYREPPDAFVFFAAGHHTEPAVPEQRTCAADTATPGEGEAAMTLFTWTPIAEASLRYRPYGSTEAWTELGTVRSSDDDTAWWEEQFETRPFEIDWATLPICFVAPQHESMAYEVEATGTDVFGQSVRSNTVGIVSPATLDRRPPMTARIIGRSSVGVVDAWSVESGRVQFSTRAVDASEADPACERATRVPSDQVIVVPNDRVIPVGVYDPAYNRKHQLYVPIPPGGRVVVCAEVFPDDNPLTPVATDRLLLVAPTQQRPRIVLQGIRRLGSQTLPEGVIIQAGAIDSEGLADPCGRFYRTPEVPAGTTLSVEQTLYECALHPLPVDSSGRGHIPIRVTRMAGSRAITEEVVVPISLDDCSTSACDRPREWYELPIPSADGKLCGSGFGDPSCDGPDPDGIAVLRVEYPVIASDTDRYGAAHLLDQIDGTTAEGNLRTAGWESTIEPSGDDLRPFVRVRFFADRPVQVQLRSSSVDDDGCSQVEEVASEDHATAFELVFAAQCAGSAFVVDGTATEPDGTVHDIRGTRGFVVPPVKNVARVQVDLLGGDDVPELGYIYRFGVELDGQSPTAYWWDWTPRRRGTADACMALNGTTARSRGYPPEIYLFGAELDVTVKIHVTTTGSDDCSGDGRTGLGEIEMSGSFTFEQLQSGEPLVLESSPDSPLQMRLTLTTERDRWRS